MYAEGGEEDAHLPALITHRLRGHVCHMPVKTNQAKDHIACHGWQAKIRQSWDVLREEETGLWPQA